VPTLSDNDKLDLSSVSWILVIEKEVNSMTLPKKKLTLKHCRHRFDP
jgi:hypothetical protein